MNIFESLENLNVSEECFNDIMGIVEAIINELKAPTPETASAVFNRKAAKLQANTTQNELLYNAKHSSKENGYHDRYPNSGTQNRYDYEDELQTAHRKIDREGQRLSRGAQRLNRWAVNQKKKGKLTSDMRSSGNGMVDAGRENERIRMENPA